MIHVFYAKKNALTFTVFTSQGLKTFDLDNLKSLKDFGLNFGLNDELVILYKEDNGDFRTLRFYSYDDRPSFSIELKNGAVANLEYACDIFNGNDKIIIKEDLENTEVTNFCKTLLEDKKDNEKWIDYRFNNNQWFSPYRNVFCGEIVNYGWKKPSLDKITAVA